MLGAGDEVFGLNLYVGDVAFERLLQLLFDELEDDPDYYIRRSFVSVCFVDRKDCTAKDLALLKEQGYKCRGKKAYPVFRDYSPGFAPWTISAEQCVLLRTAMKQTMEVSRLDPKNLDGPLEDDYLIRVPPKPPLAAWENTYYEYEQPIETHFAIECDNDVGLRKIKNTMRKAGTWTVGLYYSPSPVQEDRLARPYFPLMCLFADDNDCKLFGFAMIHNIESEGWKVIEKFIELTTSSKHLPALLRVRNEETYFVFSDIAKKLDITLKISDNFDQLNKTWMELNESMNDR